LKQQRFGVTRLLADQDVTDLARLPHAAERDLADA
jgi:hypothetical protein